MYVYFKSFSMNMGENPFSTILDTHKLIGPNLIDWLRT